MRGFVKGHDFSRAAKAAKTTGASAPEGYAADNRNSACLVEQPD